MGYARKAYDKAKGKVGKPVKVKGPKGQYGPKTDRKMVKVALNSYRTAA